VSLEQITYDVSDNVATIALDPATDMPDVHTRSTEPVFDLNHDATSSQKPEE
jgi:hypothetical protein